MHRSVSIFVKVGVVTLLGTFQANASPTFSPICFETESSAEAHRNYYRSQKFDNTDKNEQVELATKLVQRGNVKLSEMEAILGKSQVDTDDTTQITKHEWTVTFIYPAMVNDVRYNSQRGYCVDTRPESFIFFSFTWQSPGFDSPYGKTTMQDFSY